MKISLFVAICSVLFLSDQVTADADNGVKRGLFQFMAFLYYSDETVTDSSGSRFLRGAVLVKPHWLITSSVGPAMVNDLPHGFPRKTLLARLGAISIDSKFTLNEDEDEQEREVIQAVRPHNHSSTQWWRTDITLLRTLTPFNLTSAVGLAKLPSKHDVNYTNCYMLVFSKKYNWTEERSLIQLFVDVLPPTSENCGNHFYDETMMCAKDNDESRNPVYDSEFCQGNSGGPLVCENEVKGIQIYIENNCKQPHLYQQLLAWNSFITCGIEDKCQDEHCANMCIVTNKDELKDDITEGPKRSTQDDDNTVKSTEVITILSSALKLDRYQDLYTSPTFTQITERVAEESSPYTDKSSTEITVEVKATEVSEKTSWPKENTPQQSNVEEVEKVERKANVEAQRHQVKKGRGTANRNVCYYQSVLTVSLLVYLM